MTSMKTAIHEAGHARVAMHFGFDASAEIEPDPKATGRTGRSETLRPDPTPESEAAAAYVGDLSPKEQAALLDQYLLWVATICFAGPEAEGILAPDGTAAEIAATSSSDEDRASVLIWDRSDSPRRQQANLARARAEARALVRRYANEIVLIAATLLERKRLDAEDLRAIVNREVQAVA